MSKEPSSAPESSPGHAALPFVGRAAELERLTRAFAGAQSFSLLQGPAGIGKTRLVGEVVASTSMHVVTASPHRHGHPLWMWQQIGEGCSHLVSAATFAGQVAHPQRLAPIFQELASEDGPQTLDAFHSLLVATSAYLALVRERSHQGLLLVFEDLHRSDLASVELLNGIVRDTLGLHVVATMRPHDQADAAVQSALGPVRDVADVFDLGGLTHGEHATLHARLGEDPADVSASFLRTGGVPLAIRNDLLGDEPDNLAESWLDHPLIQACALLDSPIEPSILCDALELPVLDVLSTLERNVATGVLDRVGTDQFRFHHDELRQRALAHLDPDEQTRLHARLHAVLSTRFDEDPTWWDTLAHHAHQALPNLTTAEVVELRERAARNGLETGNFLQAIEHTEAALALLAAEPNAHVEDRLQISLLHARGLVVAGRLDATDAIHELLDVAEATMRPDVFMRAALLLPTSTGAIGLRPHSDLELGKLLRRALTMAGPEPTTDRARLLVEIALQEHADLTRAEFNGLMDEANQIASDRDDAALAAAVFGARHWLRREPGDAQHVLDQLDGHRSALASDDPTHLILTGLEVSSQWRLGFFDEAHLALDHSPRDFAALPPVWRWSFLRWRAAVHLLRGELDEASAVAVQAVQTVERTRWEPAAAEYFSYQIGLVIRERREFAGPLAVFEQLLSESPDSRVYRGGVGWILADMERFDEAEATLAPLFEIDWSELVGLAEWIPFITNLAAAVAALGHRDWSAACTEALAPYRDEWVVWGSGTVTDGPIALRRGHAAAVAGDFETAHRDLDLAEEKVHLADAAMYRPLVDRTRGHVYVLSGQHAEALKYFERSRDGYTQLAFDARASEVEKLIDRFELRSTTPWSLIRGDVTCTITAGSESGQVRALRGIDFLVQLLERPGSEIHVLEMSSAVDAQGTTATAGVVELQAHTQARDPVLDERAIAAYRSRLDDLRAAPASEATAQEIEALEKVLRLDLRPDGRSRNMGSDAERARVRVQKAIASAIAAIEEELPRLGAHLRSSIETGYYCTYRPTTPQAWSIDR